MPARARSCRPWAKAAAHVSRAGGSRLSAPSRAASITPRSGPRCRAKEPCGKAREGQILDHVHQTAVASQSIGHCRPRRGEYREGGLGRAREGTPLSKVTQQRTGFRRLLTSPLWLGLTGLLTAAAVVIAYVALKAPEPDPKAPIIPGTTAQVQQGCVAQGASNTVNCSFSPSNGGPSPSDLSIQVERDDEVTTFALPLDAPLETFPSEMSPGCDSKQRSWLRKYGTELPETYFIKVRNLAGSGANITFDNPRIISLTNKSVPDKIWFNCSSAGMGSIASVRADLSVDGRMTFAPPGAEPQPISLFSYNLVPGEEGDLALHLSGFGNEHSGTLVATVKAGTETRTIPVPIQGANGSFGTAGLGRGSTFQVNLGPEPGVFFCETVGKDDLANCTPSQIRARLTNTG